MTSSTMRTARSFTAGHTSCSNASRHSEEDRRAVNLYDQVEAVIAKDEEAEITKQTALQTDFIEGLASEREQAAAKDRIQRYIDGKGLTTVQKLQRIKAVWNVRKKKIQGMTKRKTPREREVLQLRAEVEFLNDLDPATRKKELADRAKRHKNYEEAGRRRKRRPGGGWHIRARRRDGKTPRDEAQEVRESCQARRLCAEARGLTAEEREIQYDALLQKRQAQKKARDKSRVTSVTMSTTRSPGGEDELRRAQAKPTGRKRGRR